MKTKKIYILLALLLATLSIQAQNELFDKLNDDDDITVVFISKSMLNMANPASMGIPGATDEMMKNLTQMEIYTSNNPRASKLMKEEITKTARLGNYEVLMQVKNKDENVVFYGVRKNENEFKEMIMLTSSSNETTIIRTIGSFTPEELKELTNPF